MVLPSSTMGADLAQRCVQLQVAEKQWLLARVRSEGGGTHTGAAAALFALLSSSTAINAAILELEDAGAEGLRAEKIGLWLRQKAARMVQWESNIDTFNHSAWCLEQTRTLQKKARPKIRSASYPTGAKARIGRAPVHAEGTLPTAPAAGTRTAGAQEETWFEATASDPSFATLVQLVSETESLFGASSEERNWWDIPALTAAVGSSTCPADRDGLRALTGRKRSATTADFARYLDAPFIGCFTAGGGNGMVILRAERGGVRECRASAHVLASVLGVPLARDHPIRMGLDAVSGPAGRMLVGQGMDVDVVAAIIRRELPELAGGAGCGDSSDARRTIHYADLFSGISFAAAAALRLRPSALRSGRGGPGRFRYRVACDAVADVLSAHQGGWAKWVERVVQFAHSQEALEAMRAAAPLDIAVAGVRCAPWSQAKTTPDPNDPGFAIVRERALEESCQAVSALVEGDPKLVILETSDWLLKGARREYWLRLLVHLQSFSGYTWGYQVICPRRHFGKWVPRPRLYVVGRRT